jgi:hypothetical protein
MEIIDLEFNHLKRDGSFVLRSERSGSEIGLHDAFRMRIADVMEFTEKPTVYGLNSSVS